MLTTMVLLASLLTAQEKTDKTSWVKSVSKDGSFSFVMPAKPIEKEVVQTLDDAPLKILEYSCTRDGCLYKIEKAPVPIKMPADKLELALEGSRNSIAQNTKLVKDEATTVAGWPARRLTVEGVIRRGQDPCTIAMLICYVENDFYQVRVFSLTPGNPPVNVKKFFDGFHPKPERPKPERKDSPK